MTTEQIIASLRGIVNTTSLNKLDADNKHEIRQLLHLICNVNVGMNRMDKLLKPTTYAQLIDRLSEIQLV